jgi:hypothetical protein
MKIRIDDFKRMDNTLLGGYRKRLFTTEDTESTEEEMRKDNAETRRAQRVRREESKEKIGTPFRGMAFPG